MSDYNPAVRAKTIGELRTKVAELEKERSKLEHEAVRLLKQGIQKNIRIIELREALERIASCRPMGYETLTEAIEHRIRKLLSRTDDTSALNDYRNSVIEEVAEEIDKCDTVVANYIRELKHE